MVVALFDATFYHLVCKSEKYDYLWIKLNISSQTFSGIKIDWLVSIFNLYPEDN